MARLTTPVPLPEYPFRIDHKQQLLCMGSCFAEHIGAFFSTRKFDVQLNSFGIVYHPLVLAKLLRQAIDQQAPEEQELFEQQGLWRHYDFHSRYAHPKKERAYEIVREQHAAAHSRLQNLDFLVLTLGTSYGYCLKDTNSWVNNCHKQAPDTFNKRIGTVEEMTKALQAILLHLKTVNPQLQVIITISPVRHLRDGLLENQRSKARLLLTQEALCERLDFVHYFPAYEIVLDELRDYRYFADDLLHPSSLAIDIVSQRFAAALFTKETQDLSHKIKQLVQACEHRPLHPESEPALRFRQQTIEKMDLLVEQYPWLDFTIERSTLLRSVDPGFPRS